MVFQKKVWKARKGVGLNKYSINGAPAVPLINQPDSITETGDAFSQENMNSLEARIESAFDAVPANAGVPELLWSGNLTLYSGLGENIDEASTYPDLFQDTGLFALKLRVFEDPTLEITPFVTTVLIDTEGGGSGTTNFSGVAMGYSEYGMGGVLGWGNIDFSNANGMVKFYDGYFYDFAEIDDNYLLTMTEFDFIELLSVHRISRPV